jgi:hypothetical protein
MKTTERENRNRWADVFSVFANGTAGQNRPSLSAKKNATTVGH